MTRDFKTQCHLPFFLNREKTAATKYNLLMQPTKMLQTSKRKFPPVQIDDTVRIQSSDVDHGRTDAGKVLAVVVGMEDSDFYKLANKNGILKQLYTHNQFEICKDKLLSIDEISCQEMSLRDATAGSLRSHLQLVWKARLYMLSLQK